MEKVSFMWYLSDIFILSTKSKRSFARCNFVTVVLPNA